MKLRQAYEFAGDFRVELKQTIDRLEARGGATERKLVYRPPGIGLVHELIHAWRNVNGLRYFKDKEKVLDAATPDDEVMTTGFPPYNNEKYSENVFRSLWRTEWSRGETLEFRVNY